MTVVSGGSTVTFAGDGVQILFDFNFRIFREDDLCAVIRSSAGDETQLLRGSDFKVVSGVGSYTGGRAQYPVSGDPLPAGSSITFFREIPYSQELELVDNDPFSASLLNEAFDRGVMRDQQLQEQMDRTLKYDISTPAVDQLSAQDFMNNVTGSRDGAMAAVDQARSAQASAEAVLGETQGVLVESRAVLGETRTVQAAAETSRTGAEAARIAAEQARDSAQAIASGDIAAMRSATPVLSGPVAADQGTTIYILIADYVEDGLTSYELNVSGFGTASLSGNTVSWLLGNPEADSYHSLTVVRRRRGEIYSETATHTVLVKDVTIQAGPTISYSDSFAGWNAAPDTNGFQPPACSVVADNTHQIISAQMEMLHTACALTILSGTTASSFKLAENVSKGQLLETDTGRTWVDSVDTVPGDTVVADNWAMGSGISNETQIDTSVVIPNGSTLTRAKGYFNMAAAVGPNFCLFRDNGNGTYTCVAIQPVSSIDYHTLNWVVPDTGTHYFGLSCTSISMYAGTLRTGVVSIAQITATGQTFSAEVTNTNISTVVEWQAPGDKTLTVTPALPGVPSSVFRNPLWNPLTVLAGTTATTLKVAELVAQGDKLKLPEKECTAGPVTGTAGDYSIDLTSAALTQVPAHASQRSEVEMTLGTGAVGEYLGPEVPLALGAGSTNLAVVVNSAESVKDRITLWGDPVEGNLKLVDFTTITPNVVGFTDAGLGTVRTGLRQDGATGHKTYGAYGEYLKNFVAHVVGNSGKGYRLSYVEQHAAPYYVLLFDPDHGDVTADFTAGNTYPVVVFQSSTIPSDQRVGKLDMREAFIGASLSSYGSMLIPFIDRFDNLAPDPTFTQDGTAGGWVLYRDCSISGGVLTCLPTGGGSCDYVGPVGGKGRKFLVKVVVDSISTGTINAYVWQNVSDGTSEGNFGQVISSPGTYWDVIEADANSSNVALGFGNTDAVVSEFRIYEVLGKLTEIAPDPTFVQDGTAGGWKFSGSAISGGLLTLPGPNHWVCTNGDYEEGSKYLIKVTIDSGATGDLVAYAWPRINDGIESENLADIPIAAGTHYVVIETDEDSVDIGLISYLGTDAVISELSIKKITEPYCSLNFGYSNDSGIWQSQLLGDLPSPGGGARSLIPGRYRKDDPWALYYLSAEGQLVPAVWGDSGIHALAYNTDTGSAASTPLNIIHFNVSQSWATLGYASEADMLARGAMIVDYKGETRPDCICYARAEALHKTLNCDGVEAAVAAVIEKGEVPNIVTSVYLGAPLAQVPVAVKISDRCTLAPVAYTPAISGSDLKITADMISLVDDPNLKRLAVAVNGPDAMRFKSGKIYIQEKF